ncbi:MAG TPA: arginine--tRNA ligase [Burkholderiales bacterium]|nr:arginine--tRNA ligase [Burkholderiales bacterium]
MNEPVFPDLRSHLTELLRAAHDQLNPAGPAPHIALERPKQASHGDYACNLALQLAKPMRRNPRDLAQALLAALPASPHVQKAEVAGAGFINLVLRPSAKQQVVRQALNAGRAYGHGGAGQGRRVLIEFVSANPTGPLHVGHGRGAAFGASLANVLAAAGYRVAREYYVNDAGRQMDILALSAWLRYLELCGVAVAFPPNAYRGDYVREMAREIHALHGDRYVRAPERWRDGPGGDHTDPETHLDWLIAGAKEQLGPDFGYFHDFVLTEQLGDCREDLVEFGVTFDQWFSERSLFDTGLVERAVALLEERGHIYVQDGARWFRSSVFGDEKDRVVQRENGQYTYFASDIAYHLNKFQRGFERVIDILGADHHGYVARVCGAIQALGLDAERFEAALVQFAVLYRGGKKVQMSTRSGDFVTLRELRREVGNDAARLFYVLRKSDQHLDFDLDLAKSQSNENPVYYLQYAHARISSVLAQWGGNVETLAQADLGPLATDAEFGLLRRLMEYPEIIESAAQDFAPHYVAFYLKDLAAEFHSYYNATHFLVAEQEIREARLALVAAVRQVLANGLGLLGVAAPDKM